MPPVERTGPSGRGEFLPRDVWETALGHARRAGYTVAVDDLFLLAVAELPEGTPARDALVAEGLDPDRLEAQITSQAIGQPDDRAGISFPPAFNGMLGRAEAFAATLGDGTITPEHVLIALIWDPTSHSSQTLWRLGIARESIVESLRSKGVPVPPAPIPRQTTVAVGERVWVARDAMDRIIAEVPRRLPAGAHFGFNYEGDRAWVVAEAGIDLRAMVDEVLDA
jgi:Clp amino terminal domain, pathogenicity island component